MAGARRIRTPSCPVSHEASGRTRALDWASGGGARTRRCRRSTDLQSLRGLLSLTLAGSSTRVDTLGLTEQDKRVGEMSPGLADERTPAGRWCRQGLSRRATDKRRQAIGRRYRQEAQGAYELGHVGGASAARFARFLRYKVRGPFPPRAKSVTVSALD